MDIVEGLPVPEVRNSRRRVVDAIVVPLLAFLVAMIVGGLLIAFTAPSSLAAWASFSQNPPRALAESWSAIAAAYGAVFQGSLGSLSGISETLTRATTLTMVGLGVTLAFRAGLFNVGGQSQFLMGTVAAAWVGFGFDWIPAPIRLVLALVAGAIGGAILGWIPGWLKVRTGAHEVITTLMLNNIMVLFVAWVLLTPIFQRLGQMDALSKVVTVRLPLLMGPDYRLHAGLVVALITAAIFWFLMSRTTWGYQIRTVGANRRAASFAGINVGAVFLGVFTVSGALAGIAGAFEVVGVQGAMFPGIAANYGFDAIAISLLARQHPAGVIVASLLFGALQAGGIGMQATTGVSVEIVQVVQALVIIFVAAPLFVRAVFRLKVDQLAAPQTLSAGWGR